MTKLVRFCIAPAVALAPPLPATLLLPAAPDANSGAALPAPFAALLPTADHNAGLLAALAGPPAAGRDAAAGLMAADPFLRPGETAAALRAAGCGFAANMPTTALFGADFAATLDDVGLGPAREFERLAALTRAGLTTLCVLCGAQWLTAALAARPAALLLAPDAPARRAEATPRLRLARVWDEVRAAHAAHAEPLPPALALLDRAPAADDPPPPGMSGVVYPSARPASP